jgi:RNA polymerase sigma-70 factor (ECF subfamily)
VSSASDRSIRSGGLLEGEDFFALMTSDGPSPSISAKLEQARKFDAFVNRYRRPLLQYFRRRGVDAADTEDLAQLVFLRVLQKLRQDTDSLSDAYVFTAASSVLIDHHRRRAANHAAASVEIDPVLASDEPDAQRILEDRQNLRVMLDVISNMGLKRRRAFVLHRFDQLTYSEIAKKMGISPSSVEKYVMAALAELKACMDRGRHD